MANNLQRDERGRLLPGSGGRIPGTRNKLQGDLITALAKDFEEHGAGVIRIVRAEKPVDYLKIIVSTLPKEFLISDTSPLNEMSDEELDKFIHLVRSNRAKVVDQE
jgi:hypothetical protein